MVPGKEREALDFLNVINLETTEVGFGTRDNYIIGYFCPKANTDPEALMKNTPRERVAPKPPVQPEGVTVTLKENSPCPELDETGKRPTCADGLCCGMSTNTDSSKTVDHCMSDTTDSYEKDEDQWSFECYEDARKLMMSLGFTIVSIAFSLF